MIVDRLLEENKLMPYTLCHGDLNLTNILIDREEKAYLIDWELVKKRPVLFDLYRIIHDYPEAYCEIESKLSSMISKHCPSIYSNDLMTFDEQVFLSILDRISRWPHIKKKTTVKKYITL